MHQWTTALIQSIKADPRTHAPPPAAMKLLNSKSKELMLWLNSEVDHLLYPVIRPVFGLLTLAMVTCASTLSHMISARSSIQILTKACLVFYRDSILSSGEYLRLHIHVLQCLLNSFCMEIGHNRQREDETFEIKNLTKELKSLLSQYDSSNTDYASVKKSTNLVFENVAILLSSEDKAEQAKRLTKEDAEMLKRQVSLEVEKLTHDIHHLNFRDMDALVLATGGLIHVDEIEFAEESLKQSGSFYLAVVTKLLENKLLTLNDAAECFFHPQTMMLCNAVFFAGIDDILLANTFISWKCLSTEFFALLARMGVSSGLLKVFNKLEAFKVDGKGMSHEEEALAELGDQYHKEVAEIMQKRGEDIISILLKQSWDKVQKKIGSSQMLLQYCMSPLYDTNCYPVPIPPKVLSLTGVVIAITSDGPPIVKTLDFGKIQDLALESHNKAMKTVAVKRQGSPWQDLQTEADKTASELLEAMFPDELQSLISGVAIESIYFCPDQVLAKFPIEILPFSDGQRLGEKVSIIYLSSARELLRESTYSLLCSDVITQDPDNKCVIFANPNFDMEKTGSGDYWSLLGSLLSPFFSTATEGIRRVLSLAGSEEEAYDIKYLLSSSQSSGELCQIDVSLGDDATLHSSSSTVNGTVLLKAISVSTSQKKPRFCV